MPLATWLHRTRWGPYTTPQAGFIVGWMGIGNKNEGKDLGNSRNGKEKRLAKGNEGKMKEIKDRDKRPL